MRRLRTLAVPGILILLLAVTAACDRHESVPSDFDAKQYASPVGKVLVQAGYKLTGPHFDNVGGVGNHRLDGGIWQKGDNKPADDLPVVITDRDGNTVTTLVGGTHRGQYLIVTVPDSKTGSDATAPTWRELNRLSGSQQQFLLTKAVAEVRAAMGSSKSPYSVEVSPGGDKVTFEAREAFEYF